MPLSSDLVSAIRERQKNGLPAVIREKVSVHIADTIAISLAAYKGAPVAMKSIAALSSGTAGGAGRVLGSEKRLPPAYAAFSNTALAHALDFDDINDLARIHPTPVTLAAALAAADAKGNSNVDVITAVGIGNELLCRLGNSVEPKGTGADANWFLSQLFGYLGAGVTAGLVLGLDDSQLAHALGLAYMQAAGGKEAGVGTGSQARSIYPAFASMGGVQAALLAREGVTAPLSSLDGKTGFFPIYFGQNLTETQRKGLLDTSSWDFEDTSIKLFPSCRYSHPYINTALALRDELKNEPIKEIIIGVNKTADMLCRPLQERRQPETLQDAKFSIPFMVAFAFVHGRVDLFNMTEDILKDSEVLELAECIRIEQTQADIPGLPVGDIKVITSGAEYELQEKLLPEVPIAEVRKKFIQCCRFTDIHGPEKLWESLNEKLDYGTINLFAEELSLKQ